MCLLKKIGIITYYYKSQNYGGNLQAYALSQVLIEQGYAAEQISFPRVFTENRTVKRKRLFRRDLLKVCFRKFSYLMYRFFARQENKKHRIQERREKAFSTFNQKVIPHSEQIYAKETLPQSVEVYDIFITGSDQVWNFFGDTHSYLLDFVPSDKTKMSYAASIAKDSLSEEQKDILRNSLKDYKAVSVREKSAAKLLEGLSPVDVQVVLDPTLLLTREDWDKVCADRVIEKKYLLCYFLGDNRKERKLAEQFAKEKGLLLVAIPHTSGIKLMDRKFGDERLYDVSPEQFLSLIKHAEYVFTDSFHAVVFSNIYQKQYFVFNRSKNGEMSSRIVDITELFHRKDRFCAGQERENMQYITSLPDIDYTKANEDFEKIKQESIAFLEKNLKD